MMANLLISPIQSVAKQSVAKQSVAKQSVAKQSVAKQSVAKQWVDKPDRNKPTACDSAPPGNACEGLMVRSDHLGNPTHRITRTTMMPIGIQPRQPSALGAFFALLPAFCPCKTINSEANVAD